MKPIILTAHGNPTRGRSREAAILQCSVSIVGRTTSYLWETYEMTRPPDDEPDETRPIASARRLANQRPTVLFPA